MTNVTLRKRLKNIDTMRKRIALRQMLNLNVVKEEHNLLKHGQLLFKHIYKM